MHASMATYVCNSVGGGLDLDKRIGVGGDVDNIGIEVSTGPR